MRGVVGGGVRGCGRRWGEGVVGCGGGGVVGVGVRGCGRSG